jgi:hypothetical protein
MTKVKTFTVGLPVTDLNSAVEWYRRQEIFSYHHYRPRLVTTANDPAMMSSTCPAVSPGKEERRELPTRRSLVQGTTIKRLGIPMECARESGLIDENTQSGRRMIV